MKAVITVGTLIGTLFARPADITRYEYKLENSGKFSFVVETSDGFHHDAKGELKTVGSKDDVLAVRGSYSYTGLEGEKYAVEYVADENGFKQVSEHLKGVARKLPLSTSNTTTTEVPEEILPPLSIGELCITCRIPDNQKRQ